MKCERCEKEAKPEKKFCSQSCRNTANVTNWRRRAKQKLVEMFGGKCSKCGYNKCLAALSFHHLRDKKFGLSLSNITNFKRLVEEAKKCVLLCANCHMEEHHGIDVPQANLVEAAGC